MPKKSNFKSKSKKGGDGEIIPFFDTTDIYGIFIPDVKY